MRVISNYLKQQDVKAWQLVKTFKESREIYMIGEKTEAFRYNTTSNYSALVHRKSKQKKTIGESQTKFQLFPRKWKQFVDQAIKMAGLIENPEYFLSEFWEADTSQNPVYDTELAENLSQNIFRINETINRISKQQLSGCKLASSEIFLERFETKFQNSNELEISLPSTKVLWDFVLLSEDRNMEMNRFSKRRFLDHFDWVEVLETESRYLNDLQNAQAPPTGKYPVILAEEPLDTLFDYFLTHASGASLYHDFSNFALGRSVYKDERVPKEALHIATSPFIVGGMKSGLIDSLGFPLKETVLIENGALKNFAINGKLSSLLGRERTTELSNIKVKAGKTRYKDFIQKGVFELLRFSTFQPDGITGAFSGEIRLGYWHKNGQKIPIKGGSLSGISQEAFLNAYFSQETVNRENYLGPQGIFFEELTLAGN